MSISKLNVEGYKRIGAPQHVIDWISKGVELTFHKEPNKCCYKNRISGMKQVLFMDQQISKLLKQKAIKEVKSKPKCILAMQCVPKKGGKLRLVMDCRPINANMTTPKFSQEGITVVSELLESEDEMITIDLQDGFHHIGVCEHHQSYLGFKWRGKYYVWIALPFGVQCAPYYFNKIVRPIVQFLWENNIRLAPFVDDFLVMAKAFYMADHRDFVIETLQQLGWKLNWEKCQLVPSKDRQFVGFLLCSKGQPWVKVMPEKIRKLRRSINLLLSKDYVSARQLARVIGQCGSTTKAVIPGKLLLRNCYRVLASRNNWEDEKGSNFIRQRNHGSVHKLFRGFQQRNVRFNDNIMDNNSGVGNYSLSKIFSWETQRNSRLAQQAKFPLQLETTSKSISTIGQSMGSSHSGPLRQSEDCAIETLQLTVRRPKHGSNRCNGSKLADGKQLLQSTLLDAGKNLGQDMSGESPSNCHCSLVARETVVPKIEKDFSRQDSITKQTKSNVKNDVKTRVFEESQMEDFCLESIWEQKLQKKGWSKNSIKAFLLKWATSTWISYNTIFGKLKQYCVDCDGSFPEVTSSTLASFLCDQAMASGRPKSGLNLTLAAVTALREATECKNPINAELTSLVTGLVKGCTSEPMVRSKVMPVEPFMKLFSSWNGNWCLALEDLCLKCITLLSLVMMLRPSDVAPHARVLGEEGLEPLVLTTKQVRFLDDGGCVITLHGIKNDYHRDGFDIPVVPTKDPKLDPVKALKCYIERTRYLRSEKCPLFLALKSPFAAVSARTVARILEKSITLAGLGGLGYSAKCFQPTGATTAVKSGFDPVLVQKIGHWRNVETFENHYVHVNPPEQFSDTIFKVV